MPPSPGNQDFAPTVISSTRRNRKSAESSGRSDNILPTSGRRNRSRGRSFDERPVTSSTCNRDVEPRSSRQAQRPRPPSQPQPSSQSQKRRNEGRQNESHLANSAFSTASSQSHHSSQGSGTRPRGSSSRPRRTANGSANNTTTGRTRPRSRPARSLSRDFRRSLSRARAPSLSRHNLISSTTRDIDISTEEGRQLKKRSVERRHKPNILERRRMDKERKVQQRLESERVNEIKGKIYYYGNGLERRDSFESKSCAGASVWSLTSAAAKSTATATTTTMRRQSSSSLTKATAATDGAGRRRRLIRRMSDSCRDLKSGLGGRRFGGGNDGEESEEDIDFFGNLGVGGNGDGKKEGGVRRPLNASRRDSMDCMRSFRRLPSVTANPLSKINDGRIDNIDNHKDKSDDNVDNNTSKHDNGGGSATAEQRQLNRKRSTSLNAGKNKHNLEEINHEARCKYSKNNSRTPSKETGRRPAEEKQQRKSAQRSGSFTLRRLSTGSCPSLGDKNKHEKRNNANDNRKTSPPPKISQRSHGKRLAKSNSVSPTRRSDDKYPPPSQHPRGDRHNQLVRRNSFDASFRVKPGDGVNKWQQPHSRSQGHHKSHNQSHARKTPSKSAAAAREHRNHSSSSHKHATSASSSKHPSSPNRRVAAASSLANKHNHTSHKNTREISPEILASMAPYENPSTNERTETKAGEGTSESDAENTSKTSKDSKERKKMMNVSRKGSAGSLSVGVKSRHRKTGSMDSAANNNNKSKTVNDSTKRHHRRNGSMDSAIKTVDKNKKKVPREGNDDHDDDESNDDEESKGNKDRKSKSTDGDKKKIKEKSTKDKKAGKNSCLTKRRCILGILLILMLAGAAVGVLMFLKPFESEGDGGEQTNLAKDSNFDALSDSRSAPTTAPTLASTAKNTEPTPVVEDVTIAIIVQLDNKPEETGFYLATVDNSKIYVSYPIGSLADRPYDDIMDMVTVPSNIPLVFTILDSAGDGIDDGYYRVFSGVGVDKKVIISGDSFISSSMNHTFVAGVDQDPLESTSSDPNESCKPCPDGGTSCGRCAWCHADQGFLPDAIHSYQCHTLLVSVPEKCFIGDKRVVHHNQYVSAAAGCKNGFQPWPQLKSASGPKVCVEEVKCVKSFEDGMPDCQMEEEGSELVQESCQDKIGGVAFGYDWGINAPREKECEAQEDFVESIAGRCCVDGISFCSTFLDSVSRPTDSKEWKQNSTLSAYSGPTPTFQPTTSNPPTWDGYPISVVLQLDDWPQETSWKITSLDESIVYGQRKPGFYKETDLVVENVQIPEGTEVLLTITDSQGDGMCCENGNGYYQVYDEKGSLILDKSGDFADSTSSIFVVADLKSLAPTSSSSPTTSPRPSYDQFTLTIVMQFDQWSSETGFSISSTDSGKVYYDWPAGTFYEPFGRSVEQIQLPLGMDVTFTVTDTGGDGMCCLYGDGSFKIFAGEDIEDDSAILVSNSGDFEKETSVSFTVGYPEESSKNSTSTEAGGTTPIGGKAKATVVMQLDKYSAETGWFILSSDGATTVISRPIGYYEANSEEKIEETIELDAGVEYKFKVTDLFGDGFCCWAGSGWYALYQGTDIENESKQLFYGDGEYGLEREHNFILESSTTVSPTNPSAALAAPSSHPTTLNAATTTAPTELTVLLDVMITFDDAAEETGWSVVSTLTGQVYLNHPPGHYDSKYSGNTITETFGVPPGEYVLHLVDSFGDGFCCDKGVGGIRISSRQESSTESSKELLSVQGSFQLTQSEVFVVDAIIPPSSIIDSSNGTVPSPPYSADNSTQYDLEELIGNSTLLTANDDNATSAASDVILIDNATLTHQQSYNTTESAESMNSTNLTTIPMPSESNTTDLEAKFADTPQGSLSNDTNRPDKVAKNLRGAVRKSRENLVLDHLTDILGEEIFREHLSVIAARWIIDLDPLRIDPDDPNLIQRFILVLFYLATDGQREGRGWTFNGIGGDGDNWLIDTPHLNECDWSGITCTETETNGVKWNAVFSIQTNGYGLDGFLPKALSKLNYLHVLDVSIMNYGLSGPLYSDILNMATLQRLAIGETSLEVDIDCNDVSFDISIGPCGIENNVNKSMKCRGACCVDYLSGNSCF